MSERCPVRKHEKPLPLRRGYLREMLPKLRNGEVLQPVGDAEEIDARRTAHIVVLDHLHTASSVGFKRPTLNTKEEFYLTFAEKNLRRAHKTDTEKWKRIKQSVLRKRRENSNSQLTDIEAAYATLEYLGTEKYPPSSAELFTELAIAARAYEVQLRAKYKEEYTNEILYRALKKNMFQFMIRIISMDNILSEFLQNLDEEEGKRKYQIPIGLDVIIPPSFLSLDKDDALVVTDRFKDHAHQAVKTLGLTEDCQGRTEDRGCPILFSSGRDALITFAINELIAQHKTFVTRKKRFNLLPIPTL